MSSYKKWFIGVLALSVAAITFVVSVTYYVDPFFRFREPRKTLYYANPPEPYANPGILKNFSYNSILLGSSMSENFKVSWLDEELNINTIKTTVAGGAPKNMELLLSRAYQYQPNLQKVFWGVDVHNLIQPHDKPRYALPEYMYQDDLKDDGKYVLYNDAFYRSIFNIVGTVRNQSSISRDDMFSWYDKYTYGKDVVLKEYYGRGNVLDINIKAKPADYYANEIKANVEYVFKPTIEEHPETDFYFFFTPGSILYWYHTWVTGDLDAFLYNEEYLIGELLKYDNVKVFFFQNNEDIILNLDNYKDYYHYSIDINQYMAQCFATGENQVTVQNYQEAIEDMRNIVVQHDYSDIFTPSIK